MTQIIIDSIQTQQKPAMTSKSDPVDNNRRNHRDTAGSGSI